MIVTDSVINGLTLQAEQQLRMVVREEMASAMDRWSHDRPPCENVTELSETVSRLEERIRVLMWLAGTSFTISATSATTLLIKMLTGG